MTEPEPPEPPKRTGGSNPKRHHVVPKFYLERFAVDEQVDLVDRADLTKSFPCSIERSLAENYFYSIDTDDGREPLGEELLRDHVDGPGSGAIRRIFDEGRPLTAPEPRAIVCMYLAFQYVRGNRVREEAVEQEKANMRVLAAMATPSEVQRIARKRGEEVTDEEAADTAAFANSGQFLVDVPHQANLHMAMAFPHVAHLLQFFDARTWQVFDFKAPLLITSDEPVALVGRDPRKVGDAGGLANAAKLIFPLDPRRALVMVRPDLEAEPGWFNMPADVAANINRHVAFGGFRYVVRTPGTDLLAGMTLPRKAPPVSIVPVSNGFIVASGMNATEEGRARMIARIQAKHGKGEKDLPPPPEPTKPRRGSAG